MLSDTEFQASKQIGDVGEEALCKFLESRGNQVIVRQPDKYFPDWDVKCQNTQGEVKTFEVKTDTQNTPNLFIEAEQHGTSYGWGPSGIFKTKADFFCIYRTYTRLLYIFPTQQLREVLRKNHQHEYITQVRAKPPTKGFRVPVHVLLEKFDHLRTPREFQL